MSWFSLLSKGIEQRLSPNPTSKEIAELSAVVGTGIAKNFRNQADTYQNIRNTWGSLPKSVKDTTRKYFTNMILGKSAEEAYEILFGQYPFIEKNPKLAIWFSSAMGFSNVANLIYKKWIQSNLDNYLEHAVNYLIAVKSNPTAFKNGAIHIKSLLNSYAPNWWINGKLGNVINLTGIGLPEFTDKVWKRQMSEDIEGWFSGLLKILEPMSAVDREPLVKQNREWLDKNAPSNVLELLNEDLSNRTLKVLYPEVIEDLALATVDAGKADITKGNKTLGMVLVASIVGFSLLAFISNNKKPVRGTVRRRA